jgi:hypothetical protein
MKKVKLQTIFSLLFAFAASTSCLAQQVTDYRYYSWNAMQENWNVADSIVVSPPTSGTVLRTSSGNVVYRNDDASHHSDNFTLLMNAGDLLATVEVTVDKLAGMLTYKFVGHKPASSSNPPATNHNGGQVGVSGPGGGTTPAGNGNSGCIGTTVTLPDSTVTGTVVGLPGTNAPIPTGGTTQIFVTDNTVAFDDWHIWWDLGGCGIYNNGTQNWFDVADVIGSVPAGTVDVIVLSGHGSFSGGVACQGGHMTVDTLTPTATTVLQGGLAPGGVVVILGCQQGTGNSAQGCQDLANTLGVPVIVNTGNVSSGTNGAGTWVQIDPEIP